MIAKKIFCFLLFSVLFFIFSQKTFAATVVINEFMPHPTSGNDWIELYNTTGGNLTIDNWKLVDSTSTMTTLSGAIEANGYKVIEVTNRLNNGGDAVTLKDETDSIADTYTYTSDPGIDVSIGRNPDGTGSVAILVQATKGSANSPVLPTPTLTPTNSPTPTAIPTATHTPTPTKTPTPTPTATKTPTPTVTSKPAATATSTSIPTATESIPSAFITLAQSNDALASAGSTTDILGDMVTASPSAMPTDVVEEVAKASFFDLPKLAIGVGFLFLAGSGILAFRSWKANHTYGE